MSLILERTDEKQNGAFIYRVMHFRTRKLIGYLSRISYRAGFYTGKSDWELELEDDQDPKVYGLQYRCESFDSFADVKAFIQGGWEKAALRLKARELKADRDDLLSERRSLLELISLISRTGSPIKVGDRVFWGISETVRARALETLKHAEGGE